ncbi:unnamed protein product [Sphenostylis stenocarpa]|uniref:Uncharacterized protein n=1 Tax=Sphenostylis stenocarpa TaxID=92480 RepID=A0AA86SZW2_9FABA|nr:unnamed protein product [Sphenostylis stenocarpa]
MNEGGVYYDQDLNGNFIRSDSRQSFLPRVVQLRNLIMHTGCCYQTVSSKRHPNIKCHVRTRGM